MTQTSESESESGAAAAPWGSQIRERLGAVANVIAPTTVVTTLLFYFGYVATTARFGHFGVYAGNSRTLVVPYDNTVRIHLIAG